MLLVLQTCLVQCHLLTTCLYANKRGTRRKLDCKSRLIYCGRFWCSHFFNSTLKSYACLTCYSMSFIGRTQREGSASLFAYNIIRSDNYIIIYTSQMEENTISKHLRQYGWPSCGLYCLPPRPWSQRRQQKWSRCQSWSSARVYSRHTINCGERCLKHQRNTL